MASLGSLAEVSVEDLLRLGNEAKDNGDNDLALQYYHEASARGSPDGVVAKGVIHYRLKQFDEAIKSWEAMDTAETKNLRGVCYFYGQGYAQDTDKAEKLLLEAAEAGSTSAHYNISILYNSKKDYKKEFEHCYQAAEDDYTNAIIRLASLYQKGRGTDKNMYLYATCVKKAAEAGSPDMQVELANLYSQGLYGIPKDIDQAEHWYRSAVNSGTSCTSTAMNNLAALLHASPNASEQISQIISLYEKAVDLGSVEATINLAHIYETADGVPKDLDKAFELYNRQASHPDAMAGLARIHSTADSKYFDSAKAETLLQEAANKGSKNAQSTLASQFELGSNEGKAVEWYSAAAQAGDIQAQIKMGNRAKADKDYASAYKWYGLAAQKSTTARDLLNQLSILVERELFV